MFRPPDRKLSAIRPRPFLSLLDASFRLGERLVFQNTSWTFHRHEHWAITGPNGSGKSLLADALRARLPVVHGELRYCFRPPRGLSPEESIGHVSFENRRLTLHDAVAQSRWNSLEEEGALRVCDFLSYERVMEVNPFEVSSRHNEAKPGFERRRTRAISLLHLGPLLERTLLSLSNGETQRAQLARALCQPLRLLILDEPFVGLDVATRDYLHGVLERLMDTSVRVLLITTRMEELPAHISHVLRVEDCQVVATGPRKEMVGLVRTPKRSRGRKVDTQGARVSVSTTRNARAGFGSRELVRLRNATVRYGKTPILRNLNWVVKAGESWALLGPNGCGKSTLLSLINGDHPQVYRNEVEVFGRRRGTGESIWEVKRDIGWVSPELHLHFDAAATCFEVAASGFHETVGLFEPPTARQRAAVRHWLARFDLLKAARTPLYALSTGWQRMVLLVRALVKSPRLLILDEPCQGLDPAHRNLFVSAVDNLLRSGSVTTIYVTHRADEIPASITRTLRLPEGRVVARRRSGKAQASKRSQI